MLEALQTVLENQKFHKLQFMKTKLCENQKYHKFCKIYGVSDEQVLEKNKKGFSKEEAGVALVRVFLVLWQKKKRMESSLCSA